MRNKAQKNQNSSRGGSGIREKSRHATGALTRLPVTDLERKKIQVQTARGHKRKTTRDHKKAGTGRRSMPASKNSPDSRKNKGM